MSGGVSSRELGLANQTLGFVRRLLVWTSDTSLTFARKSIWSAGFAAAVLVQALRPRIWRPPIRDEFYRHSYQVAIKGLWSTIVTGALFGFGVVLQALYWLGLAGDLGLVGDFLVLILIREIAPVVIGFIVIGRNGSVMLVELLNLRAGEQTSMLSALGIEPFHYLVVPRVLALALSVFCLSVVFVIVALFVGFVLANVWGVDNQYSLLQFAQDVLDGMGPQEYLLLPLKTLSIGFVIGLVCCATGLSSENKGVPVSRILPLGFARSGFGVLVVTATYTLLL